MICQQLYFHGSLEILVTTECELTGKVISEEYSLEYGTDTMEMHVGAVEAGERGIIIDDLIATGGTLSAAIKLLGKVFVLKIVGYQVGLVSWAFYFYFYEVDCS